MPPFDSQYFTHQSFVTLHEKMVDYKSNTEFCIIGDLNARFGTHVRNIPLRSSIPEINACTYPYIPDDITSPNDNAYLLSALCTDNDLIVVNNVKTATLHFPSNKTYKKRNQWISELDTAIVSYRMLSCLSNFNVHQTDWLPSDHAPISIDLKVSEVNMDCVLERANNLGGHGSMLGQAAHGRMVNRPVRYEHIDRDKFANAIDNITLPDFSNNDVNLLVYDISNSLYDCVNSCSNANSTHSGSVGDNSNNTRWERLLNDRDDARVWKALDWKGQFCDNDKNNIMPSDTEFKGFFDNYLSKYCSNSQVGLVDNTGCPNVPILDDPVVPDEVINQIGRMKSVKSCGADGIPPGIFKLLTLQWIMLITSLFNLILISATYPVSWSRAKLFMLFKRGNRKDPNNYRGISVINAIAKLFDMILCNRLELWFKPYREQAGAQKGRGCIEHIVTLRLLADYAKRKKAKLFITFVDFSKAYDLVPRHMLFSVLKRLGCGAVMLSTIIAMYSVTQSIVGTAVITTAIGVRQGSPTSCFLLPCTVSLRVL